MTTQCLLLGNIFHHFYICLFKCFEVISFTLFINIQEKKIINQILQDLFLAISPHSTFRTQKIFFMPSGCYEGILPKILQYVTFIPCEGAKRLPLPVLQNTAHWPVTLSLLCVKNSSKRLDVKIVAFDTLPA